MSKSGGSSSSPYPMKSFASGGSSSKNQQSDGPFVYKAKGNTKFKPKKLVVSKSSAKGDQLEYDKAMKEFKQELSKKGSSSSKRGNQEDKQAASKTEVVERKIEIDKAEDDEETAENALRSVRELAHVRYLRNHRLVNEIFSPDVVFPTRPVISQAHLDNLKATVQRLTAHREKLVSDIDKMEERFQSKKQSVLEAIDVIMKLDKKEHYIKMAQERMQQQQQQQQQLQAAAALQPAPAAASQAAPTTAALPAPVQAGPSDQVVPEMPPPEAPQQSAGGADGAEAVEAPAVLAAPVADNTITMDVAMESQVADQPPPLVSATELAPKSPEEQPPPAPQAPVEPTVEEQQADQEEEEEEAMEVDSASVVDARGPQEGEVSLSEDTAEYQASEMTGYEPEQPPQEETGQSDQAEAGAPTPQVAAAESITDQFEQPPPPPMELAPTAEPVVAPEPTMDQVPIVSQINPSFESPPTSEPAEPAPEQNTEQTMEVDAPPVEESSSNEDVAPVPPADSGEAPGETSAEEQAANTEATQEPETSA